MSWFIHDNGQRCGNLHSDFWSSSHTLEKQHLLLRPLLDMHVDKYSIHTFSADALCMLDVESQLAMLQVFHATIPHQISRSFT